jgi:hypothetical protein
MPFYVFKATKLHFFKKNERSIKDGVKASEQSSVKISFQSL